MKVTPLGIRALPGELTLDSTWMKLVNLCPQKISVYIYHISNTIYIYKYNSEKILYIHMY